MKEKKLKRYKFKAHNSGEFTISYEEKLCPGYYEQRVIWLNKREKIALLNYLIEADNKESGK